MYNSNYPTSYGSYGSMGSYGGYGSQYGGSSMMGGMRNGQNPQLPNNQQNPDQNERKKVFEQYFKMMGGMRSMLELGFAGIAFYNFGSKAVQLIKKILVFLFKTSKHFLSFVAKFIPVEQLKDALITTTGSKGSLKWENLIISIIRIGLIAILGVSYRMRNSMKQQVITKHEQLSKKAQEIQKKKETITKNMEKFNQGSNL